MDEYHAILAAAAAMMTVGVAVYWLIFARYNEVFEFLSFRNAAVDLVSHLPEAKAGPTMHVAGTVLLLSGLCIAIALVLADLLFPGGELTTGVLGVASILLSISFSIISMWTLWQTRRIDFTAGYKIADFGDLIAAANDEIEKVLASYRLYDFQAQPFHRFYLVTTQPFFGMLSYPTSAQTAQFKSHLIQLADYSKKASPFDMHLLCGDKEAVKQFHAQMVDRLKLLDDEKKRKREAYDLEVENAISDLVARSGAGVVVRRPKVPPVQFMIVGNKLFEFTLETGNVQSEIFNTQVITDSRYSAAYIEVFKMLNA